MKILKIFESSKDSNRRIANLPPDARKAPEGKNLSCTINLDLHSQFQTVKGFGCAITESSGYVLSHLSDESRLNIIESCFGQGEESNNYQFARTHMNSCDFSLENWACVPEKDETLESFSFKRTDLYMTPVLKQAINCKKNLSIIVTPWSPPAWMKTNNDMNHGGKLKPEYTKLWAEYFVKFIKGLNERGINVEYVSIQNEPEAVQTWDSCIWTGTEEAEFATQFLKPAFVKNGLEKIKIFIWDHNRDNMLKRMKESFAVPGAKDAIDGLAYHWYSGDQYDNVKECAGLFPNKELFFTEGCIEGGSRPNQWYCGERYGHNIINDLNSGCTAWIDWNLALNIDGGPNHVGNNCDAPILVDTATKKIVYQSSFYFIGHFSRFILPGSKRISCAMNPFMTPATVDGKMGNTMEATSFLRPDGKIALVVMNRTEDNMIFELNSIDEKSKDKDKKINYTVKVNNDNSGRTFFCPPRSIQTYLLEDI
ncbi:MAG: glycoside hydrolase family 30 beta sandwich domain-containing protein [Treponema sp.]